MPPKVSNAYRKGGCMAYKNEQPIQGRKTAVDFAKIGITNDVMFGMVFKNADDCKELLQRIQNCIFGAVIIIVRWMATRFVQEKNIRI